MHPNLQPQLAFAPEMPTIRWGSVGRGAVVIARRRRRSALLWAVSIAAALSVPVVSTPAATAANNSPRNLWVDQARPSCSDSLTREQVTEAKPWCSLQAAAAAARAGDTVQILPGRYLGTVRATASGSASAPIRFIAAEGVTLDAAGATVGLEIVGVNWVSFEGLTITGAAAQGIYVDRSSNLTLTGLKVEDNGSYGVQTNGRSVTVSYSTISHNRMAGISELPNSFGNLYEHNTITGNGKDGRPYNGDGLQLNGSESTVRDNTITSNGDRGIYEHGIYAGRQSSDYVIESNTLADNAASDIKAAGSSGIVRYNRLGNSRLGLVFSDNAQPVSAYYNMIAGEFQHAVFFTTGTTASRSRLWNNTIVQTGRLTDAGDASAVFVNSTALADIRNNVICYTNPDNLGGALFLNDSVQTRLASNSNWFCSSDRRGRTLSVNGRRTTLGAWRATTGNDITSLSTKSATFDTRFHVTSTNLGKRRGQPLQLKRDYAGSEVPFQNPDIGAYQSRF